VIPIVVLAILGAAYMWWRKRRQPKGTYGMTNELPAEPKRGELSSEPGTSGVPGGPTKFSNYAYTTPAELPVDGSG